MKTSRTIFLWATTAVTTFFIILIFSNYQQEIPLPLPHYKISNISNVSTIDSILIYPSHTEKSSSFQNISSYVGPFPLTTHSLLPFFWCSAFPSSGFDHHFPFLLKYLNNLYFILRLLSPLCWNCSLKPNNHPLCQLKWLCVLFLHNFSIIF